MSGPGSSLVRLRHRVIDSGYALGWRLLRKTPERVTAAVFRAVADWVWWRRGQSVRQLEWNLTRVLGTDVREGGAAAEPRELVGAQVRALSKEAMRSYLRYWLEVFRLPEIGRERIMSGMRVTGHEKMFATLDSGRGAILALPHMGNYEQAGAWMVHQGYPFTTVAERLPPDSLYDRFVAFREALGMEVLPFGTMIFGTLARRLRDGRLVCLVADRDLGERGMEVDFFGRLARLPGGPAALATQTGAALYPVTLWYEGRDWGARVHDEIPIPEGGTRAEKIHAMTQELARAYEEGIAAHPEDWHMLQRVWVEDL